ncbi:PP2C family protein-serine/threonine phosphatase [Microscilla marina]|uniref:Multi-sensor Hybrid Histidine Kinase n=1 Tax=Microscilla marina ATCC 23134 TaxID=313606 RepID=A1ZZA0_MICM2|nr:GAF domain-containing protein [Microscilla marina]EAY24301.1 multi-sensor Hybrid Histidine Kinase [Microscilla marina ATCC 23134]
MKIAPITPDEPERLKTLHRYNILDTGFEQEFDDLVKLASHICETPVSLMSLVAEDKQWFKAKVGLEPREAPRELSFCAHAIHTPDLFVVKDATKDERFHDNPFVADHPKVRFYAGMPLTTPDGFNLGTLCVIDQRPRDLDEAQKKALKTLAAQVIAQLELRLKLKTIGQEKRVIAEKNRAIVESIRYAKRIQRAMLPAIDEVNKMFDEFFVFNQPRDIIGGDFYWISEVKDKKIVVVADCTGHGVPGALMGMLGNTLLRDVVDKKHVTEPEKILSYLNTEISKVLHQQDNDNHDGMDMGVVCIDDKAQTLTFAGAHHKMVYIRDNESFIIPGDRCGVGGNNNSRRKNKIIFTAHTVDFSDEGEQPIFYLFSDGFRDQFGGEKNKKYTLRRLIKKLHNIYQKPGSIQQIILRDELKEWMTAGSEVQIDDVLLLGFRPKSAQCQTTQPAQVTEWMQA